MGKKMNNTDEKIVVVKPKIEFKDYKRFILSICRKGLIIEPIFYFILCYAVFLVLTIRNGGNKEVITSGSYICLPAAFLISSLALLFSIRNIHLKSKRIYNSDEQLQQDYYFIFTDRGICIESKYNTSIIRWNDVYKAVEMKDTFAVYLEKNQFLIMPKRFFDEAGSRTFKDIAVRNMPLKKVKWKHRR